jgi:uncharacterized glyoxalase superfamily protein PhnB
MSLSILLRCLDIDKTREFYETLLGSSVALTAENTLTVTHGGARLVFTSQNLWSKDPTFSGTIYMTVSDVERLFALIAPKASVAWPVQTMAYGSKEFAIHDCNGYLIAFQQLADQQ